VPAPVPDLTVKIADAPSRIVGLMRKRSWLTYVRVDAPSADGQIIVIVARLGESAAGCPFRLMGRGCRMGGGSVRAGPGARAGT
jgi:hypothetical protein